LLTLKLPKAGNVTIEVISRFPQDLRTTLLTVDDPCDPATCVAPQNASGILTRGGLAAGDHVFILEVEERAGLGFVFTAEIAVTCH
jgi:hypothetical protein